MKALARWYRPVGYAILGHQWLLIGGRKDIGEVKNKWGSGKWHSRSCLGENRKRTGWNSFSLLSLFRVFHSEQLKYAVFWFWQIMTVSKWYDRKFGIWWLYVIHCTLILSRKERTITGLLWYSLCFQRGWFQTEELKDIAHSSMEVSRENEIDYP